MRLTLRLLALTVLLSVASFTGLVSPVSKAEDSSACTDGCINLYTSCLHDCGNPGTSRCQLACSIADDKCQAKCRPNAD